MKRFNEDQIRRVGLPMDVFGLIHDLCYHHDGRDVNNYVERAQAILRANDWTPKDESDLNAEARQFLMARNLGMYRQQLLVDFVKWHRK